MQQIRWTFKKEKTQNYTHGLHQYPARLHPAIVSAAIKKFPRTDLVIDPFMGSGTVLVESTLNGKNSLGFDINLFACFLAKVKTRKLNTPKIQDEVAQILTNSEGDLKNKIFHLKQIPTDFDVDYWFKPKIAKKLAILKYHIKKIPPGKYQDFLKICLSMTVRKSSNHRNDVYKNHRMSKEDLIQFNPDVFKIFSKICQKNCQLMDDFSSNVDNDTKAIVKNGNSMQFSKNFAKISTSEVTDAKRPLILTSPPYGDSRTTVAYGEYVGHLSSWLDFPKDKIQFLDKIGLGGRVYDLNNELNSKKLTTTIRKIEKNNEYRAQQVYQFFSDFDKSLEEISNVLNKNSNLCFVVANRNVTRVPVKMDLILVELAKNHHIQHISTHTRRIMFKAMATKNAPNGKNKKPGKTMLEEKIVFLKS